MLYFNRLAVWVQDLRNTWTEILHHFLRFKYQLFKYLNNWEDKQFKLSLPLGFLEQTQPTIEFPTSCWCCLSCDDAVTSVTPRPLGRLCSWSRLLCCSRASKRETTKRRHQLISPRSLGKQREGQQFNTCHSKALNLLKGKDVWISCSVLAIPRIH